MELEAAEQPQAIGTPDPETPFHILVAGNFGGAGRNRKMVGIDRDDFDIVTAFVAPRARVTAPAPIEISFSELDDFHPDRLFERLAPFQSLRQLRRRLADPTTFAAAAAEIAPLPAAAPSEVAGRSGADLLSMMLGEAPAAKPAPARSSDWDRMLREMVAPYAVPGADPRQPELLAQTDAAIAGQMNAVLHDPAFQALEAAWRGLYFLARRLETGEDLKIFLLDLPQEELATEEGINTLVRTLADGPWSVLAGLWNFGTEDEALLERLASLAATARAPLIAGLAPDVVGLTGAFAKLRRSPDARWLGLAVPRFLLRLPYGAKTSAIDSFEFEEMPAPPVHERYLWGHPALACACLLGETFSRYGWEMRPGTLSTIDGLPAHIYKGDGLASELKPCAEVLLTEDAALLLMERGLIPLASIKDSDSVRVVRFQSVADPLALLAGKWS